MILIITTLTLSSSQSSKKSKAFAPGNFPYISLLIYFISGETDHRIYHLILMRLVRVCHTKELINCHGAITCLTSLTELIPSRYFVVHYFDIIQSIFNVIQKIPEVIQLPIFDKCLELLKILANYFSILADQGVGLYHICDSLGNFY